MPEPDAKRTILEVAVLLAVCGFLFFYGLGSFGLLGADEPRYAQIGAEMLARHDWVVPTLNGTPWLEKPALLYWGEMASYALFGPHDWAARVPSATLATLMIFAIWWFVRRRIGGWGLDAALISASCIFAVSFGRGASTDMPLTACFTIGILAWMEWFVSGRRRWLLGFYAFQALGMLAKGPVSPFLAGLVIVVFALLWRPRKPISSEPTDAGTPANWRPLHVVLRTLWWPGILLFLAISIPWYVEAQLKTGNFFRVFLLEHNLERFGTNRYAHRQPFWYFFVVLLLGMLPWTAIFVAELVNIARNFRAWLSERPLTIFVTLWCALPVLFFSLSVSKLPGYILPAIPAAALLVVAYLHERRDCKLPVPLVLIHGLCCGVILALVLVAPHLLLKMKPSPQAIIYSVVAGLMVFVLVVFLVQRQGVRAIAPATLIPIVVAVGFIVKAAAPVVDATQSARPLALEIKRVAPRDLPIVLFRLPRPAEFGVQYYRRGAIAVSEEQALPNPPYVLVARPGERRSGALLGRFAPQKIDIYVVLGR